MLLVFRLSRRQPFPMTKSYYKINKFTNTHIQYKERESEREREKERWKIIIVIEKKNEVVVSFVSARGNEEKSFTGLVNGKRVIF